jgi:putative membrane protein
MSYLDDPRVLFAAERTLLAWQRTAMAVIGLGIVIERFGLFMRFVNGARLPPHQARMSFIVALLCLLLGAWAALISSWQYRRFLRQLHPSALPSGYMTWPGPAMNHVLATVALAAAVWMMVAE